MYYITIFLSLIILSSINTTISETSFMQNGTESDNEMRKLQSSYVMASNSTLLPVLSGALNTKHLAESELVKSLLQGLYF